MQIYFQEDPEGGDPEPEVVAFLDPPSGDALYLEPEDELEHEEVCQRIETVESLDRCVAVADVMADVRAAQEELLLPIGAELVLDAALRPIGMAAAGFACYAANQWLAHAGGPREICPPARGRRGPPSGRIRTKAIYKGSPS